jgi:low temperature requirement protein LtrA
MIALGESILAVGAAAEFTLTAGQVFAALFGIAAVAALWWAYFDVVAIVAERRLAEAPPGEQAPLARDAYSYLHFPLIAGIVLLALGLKETLALTGESLETVPALALCGGPALYLLGQIAFRERTLGSFSPHRALAAVALLSLIPLALGADALVALAAVATVLAILVSYEAVHFRETRARVRANPSASLAEMRG